MLIRTAAIAILISTGAMAQEKFDVKVLNVIDSHTILIDERCSRFQLGCLLRVRVWGVDGPESREDS
jgi:hypothetical protein